MDDTGSYLAHWVEHRLRLKVKNMADVWYSPEYRYIGVPFVRNIDGKTIPDPESLIHEICHWLVATEEERSKTNFGLVNNTDEALSNEHLTVSVENMIFTLTNLKDKDIWYKSDSFYTFSALPFDASTVKANFEIIEKIVNENYYYADMFEDLAERLEDDMKTFFTNM